MIIQSRLVLSMENWITNLGLQVYPFSAVIILSVNEVLGKFSVNLTTGLAFVLLA